MAVLGLRLVTARCHGHFVCGILAEAAGFSYSGTRCVTDTDSLFEPALLPVSRSFLTFMACTRRSNTPRRKIVWTLSLVLLKLRFLCVRSPIHLNTEWDARHAHRVHVGIVVVLLSRSTTRCIGSSSKPSLSYPDKVTSILLLSFVLNGFASWASGSSPD
jgi:hypothetical protein